MIVSISFSSGPARIESSVYNMYMFDRSRTHTCQLLTVQIQPFLSVCQLSIYSRHDPPVFVRTHSCAVTQLQSIVICASFVDLKTLGYCTYPFQLTLAGMQGHGPIAWYAKHGLLWEWCDWSICVSVVDSLLHVWPIIIELHFPLFNLLPLDIVFLFQLPYWW
jgi:hypothetical protein